MNIRSIPEPARLDWVPPNVDSRLVCSNDMQITFWLIVVIAVVIVTELPKFAPAIPAFQVAEYMNELEVENIPISGTKAAIKRKERLNYQVPIYDLDASLCHNLSENEATQLSHYVGQLKERNVGQGVVVRIEGPQRLQRKLAEAYNSKANTTSLPIPDAIKRDKILNFILSSESIQKSINHSSPLPLSSSIMLSNRPLNPDFKDKPYLNDTDKSTLEKIKIDSSALQSSIINGRFYDKLFAKLDACKVNYAQCHLLQPLHALRAIYNGASDRQFNANVDNVAVAMESESPIDVGSRGLEDAIDKESSLYRAANSDDILPLLDALKIDESPIYENVAVSTNIAGPKAAMNCRSCMQAIYVGTVAVKAHRAGAEAAWHPKCFTCHRCGDLLADLVYFFHQGNIYCGRDLAEILKIPRCKACDELIFTAEYTAAEAATFHIKHFCCYHCDTPLAGKQYTPDDETNMPLCLDCYDKYFADRCQNCQRTINPAEEAVSWQKSHWHKPCFNCAGANCGKSLIGGRFCIKFELPFCSSACMQDSRQY